MNAIAVFENHQAITGFVKFHQPRKNSPLQIEFNLKGLTKICAVHIHEYGDVSNGCMSLGGHFNPTKKKHGQHAGDIIFNAFPDKNGHFKTTFSSKELSLIPGDSLNIIGRSVVIHNFEDDYGKFGRIIDEKFVLYDNMSVDELRYFSKMSGYSCKDMKKQLNQGSASTGNAGSRLACAIIGLSS